MEKRWTQRMRWEKERRGVKGWVVQPAGEGRQQTLPSSRGSSPDLTWSSSILFSWFATGMANPSSQADREPQRGVSYTPARVSGTLTQLRQPPSCHRSSSNSPAPLVTKPEALCSGGRTSGLEFPAGSQVLILRELLFAIACGVTTFHPKTAVSAEQWFWTGQILWALRLPEDHKEAGCICLRGGQAS
jgi:hypothetical protein